MGCHSSRAENAEARVGRGDLTILHCRFPALRGGAPPGPQIPPQRFQETLTAFGQYTDVLHNLILYVIDNEIHHRGQGYVYLRALGIAPPPFYQRD